MNLGPHITQVARDRAQRAPWTEPIFRAKAPLRLSFAGGGTDVPPFPERETGYVLSATINRYAHGMLRPRTDDRIRVESTDLGMALEYGARDSVRLGGDLDIVRAAVRRIAQLGEPSGVDIYLRSGVPPGSGLGGSSALVVALIGLLRDFHKLALSDYDIAGLACDVERGDLSLQGGLQDQYASTFGGFNFIEFGANRVLVNPLRVSSNILHELEENLILCFTGSTRSGDHIIVDQTNRYIASDHEAITGLRMQKSLAIDMKDALLQGKLTDFGELLGTAWDYKKRMSPRITTPIIDGAYAAAREAGALGGKVTGAGGGGFMLFYCRPGSRHQVSQCLAQLGLAEADFTFDEQGLRTWTHVET